MFKAVDIKDGQPVAIKFMDPDFLGDDYRLNCFKREPKILLHLLKKRRCLQIKNELNKFSLKIPIAPGNEISFPCEYFVTKWISLDIDGYFLSRANYNAREKLEIFKLIILAVEAIHRQSIFHRDLKPDNMRAERESGDLIVYVIDFGTAAQHESKQILTEYGAQVGASLYSAPETFVGFSGDRQIASYTDFFALGCILYELFNDSLFFAELYKNQNFQLALSMIGMIISAHRSPEARLSAWDENVNKIEKMVVFPPFEGPTCNAPTSIVEILGPLLAELTEFDFNKRLHDFNKIREKIDVAIQVLNNVEEERIRSERRRIFRENKLKKLQDKEKRLHAFLRGKITC